MSAPDVIVAWLQNDYGRLARPAEAMAHAMVDEGLARRVAYVEPFTPGAGEPAVQRTPVRGVDVYQGTGDLAAGEHDLARTVIAASELEDPVLLNCGVVDANWFFHYEFAPYVARTVLVTHDKWALADLLEPDEQRHLTKVRDLVVRGHDVVCGLSLGSIDDVPGAHYVGHGVDTLWTRPGVDDAPEPADLAAIPHPRAIYVGALSLRFDVEATRALARAGIQVVLVGFEPSPEVAALIAAEPNVHLLGERAPEQTPGYLLHSDLGIIPHTDEPFTRSMEPHKAYNYGAAGLRTVAIRTPTAPALDAYVTATEDADGFVAGAQAAVAAGRLSAEQTAAVRAITWGSVAARILAAAG